MVNYPTKVGYNSSNQWRCQQGHNGSSPVPGKGGQHHDVVLEDISATGFRTLR